MRAKLLLLTMPFLVACAPYRIEYEHLVFVDVPGLTVQERSKPGSPPNPDVKRAKYGLPVRLTLARAEYTLTFEARANSSFPGLQLGARSPTGESLRIEGPHLALVHPDVLSLYPDFPYYFDTPKAGGAPLAFVVRDASGKQLGAEKLDYDIVVSGVIWGIEWV